MTKAEKLEKFFKKMRFSKNNHLGLGDIRMTVGQQEELVKMMSESQEEENKCALCRQPSQYLVCPYCNHFTPGGRKKWPIWTALYRWWCRQKEGFRRHEEGGISMEIKSREKQTKTYLCVGGPIDGERHTLPAHLRGLEVPAEEYPDQCASRPLKGEITHTELTPVLYTPEEWSFRGKTVVLLTGGWGSNSIWKKDRAAVSELHSWFEYDTEATGPLHPSVECRLAGEENG